MPMLQPSSGRAVGRPPTAIDKREKNLKWKVSKLVAQTGRASSLHLAEKAGVKRSKVADEQAEAQLKALMARQRDQKVFHHRKKLQAAVKLAKQHECRRLASRLKKLNSEPSPDLAATQKAEAQLQLTKIAEVQQMTLHIRARFGDGEVKAPPSAPSAAVLNMLSRICANKEVVKEVGILKALLAQPIELPPKVAETTPAESDRTGKRKKPASTDDEGAADGGGDEGGGEDEPPARRRKSESLPGKRGAIKPTAATTKTVATEGAAATAARTNGGADKAALHSSWAAKRALKEKLAQANFVGSKQTFDEDSDSEGPLVAPTTGSATSKGRGGTTASRTCQADAAIHSRAPTTVASKTTRDDRKRAERPAATTATGAADAALPGDAAAPVRPSRSAFVEGLGILSKQSDRSRSAVANNSGTTIEKHPSWAQRLQAKEALAKQTAAVPQGQRLKFDDDSD